MKTKFYSLIPIIRIFTFLSIMFFQTACNNDQENKYSGLCNASAAVALDADHFVVADDEVNTLQIFNRHKTGKSLQTVPLSSIFPGEIEDGEDLEIDLEGAATLGDYIFWIGSHSTSKKGNDRPARHRLFALQIKPDAEGQFVATRVGKIYTSLVADIDADTRFAKYKIHQAMSIKAKEIGGLSIEGLAATPEGALLIGFRNPLSGGKVKKDKLLGGQALLVKLVNPLDVIDGKAAQFDDPIELDLDGYGIRSIEYRSDNEYLIVAGPYHENQDKNREESRLYLWSDKLRQVKKISLDNLNIEAAFFFPQEAGLSVQLLSDDGNLDCDNSFRSRSEALEKH